MATPKNIIKRFGANGTEIPNALKGDTYLFRVLDLDLDNEALPHLMTGEQTEGLVLNSTIGSDNWDIEFYGENASSSATRRNANIQATREALLSEYGDLREPETMSNENAKLRAEIEDLRARLEGKRGLELATGLQPGSAVGLKETVGGFGPDGFQTVKPTVEQAKDHPELQGISKEEAAKLNKNDDKDGNTVKGKGGK